MKYGRIRLWAVSFFSTGMIAITILATGCPEVVAPDSPDPDSMDSGTPPNAADLFSRITQEDPYTAWGQFPDAQGVLSAIPPHSPFARTWINDTITAALAEGAGVLPNDSIVVKELLATMDAAEPSSLTVMWKVADFDPNNNNWFWAEMTPDGTVMAEGKVASCIVCHTLVRNNDFIYLQGL